MYSGEELYNKDGTYIPDTLYIFDWDGELKLVYNLPERFTKIQIDNDWMYFIHYKGKISKCPVNSVTQNI